MSQNQKTHPLLETARQAYVFSAYQLTCEHAGRSDAWYGGKTSYWPGAESITPKTLFDIGSVTKAVVTTSLFARALSQGRVDLGQAVQHWVPELAGTALGPLLLSDLLSHGAGLKAWLPLFRGAIPADRRAWMRSQAPHWVENSPASKAVYSDLGFLLLGEVLTSIFQVSLKKAFEQQVAGPLGLGATCYGPVGAAAATEVREGKPLVGRVFDENCEALGGVGGHAGLFSTAQDLAAWARAWLDAVRGTRSWIEPAVALRLTQRWGKIKTSPWALGWDTPSQPSSSGRYFSPESFGHLGYPGCSVWIDPKRQGFVIFLSNRVHPSRLDERIRRLRPELHDMLTAHW